MNSSIDRAFCISLDRRPDRWQAFKDCNVPLGYDFVEKFPAIDGSKLEVPRSHEAFRGTAGCLHSHAAVAEYCLDAGIERALVVEDDCQFQIQAHELFEILPTISDLPYAWIHLGGPQTNAVPLKERIDIHHKEVNSNINTHAQVMTRPLMEALVTYVRGCAWPTSISIHSDRLLVGLCQRNRLPMAATRKRLAVQNKSLQSDVTWSTPDRLGFKRNPKHFFKDIHGWFDFEEIYTSASNAVKTGDTIVEIGSWLGRSAAFMAVELQSRNVYPRFVCIDPFDRSDFKKHVPQAQNHREAFESQIRPVRDAISIIQENSIEAARLFENESISFAFIDSLHTYDHLSQEIEAWLPKIKEGGILAGHDYDWREVRRAVTEKLPTAQRVRNSWVFYKSMHFRDRVPLMSGKSEAPSRRVLESEVSTLVDALRKELGECKEVQYMPNHGNAGDAVIALGVKQALERLSVSVVNDADTVLVAGGGNLIPDYTTLYRRMYPLKRSGKRVVVLPHTVYRRHEFLREFPDLVLFARDHVTHQNGLAAGVDSQLVHDAAFAIDYARIGDHSENNNDGVLNAFRGDGECRCPARRQPSDNQDISEKHKQNWNFNNSDSVAKWFINTINRYQEIRTDRLHVAIVAANLGKKVTLFPNRYYKNKAVYETSLLQFENVTFEDFGTE